MKFSIFSNKKKKDKSASLKGTDFLNPKSAHISDSVKSDKKKEDKDDSSKEEKKLSKKELKKAQKKKEKAEARREEELKKKEAEEKEKIQEQAEEEKELSKKELKKEQKKKKAEAKKAKKEEKQRKKEEEARRKEEEKIAEEEREMEEKKRKKEDREQEQAKELEEKSEQVKATKKDEQDNLEERNKVQNKDENKKALGSTGKSEKGSNKDNQTGSNHEFEKSNILEINLVKDEINVYFDWYKNIAMLVVFVFLSFILVLEVYLALSWWQNQNNNAVGQEEARFIELNKEIVKIRGEAEEALSFQTKLNRANYVLDNHLYWSNFFNYLERNTIENIQYASFEGSILGNFSIPAVSDSFPSLGQQVYQLQSDPHTVKASIDKGEKLESEEENIEEIEFEIDLMVSPELFKK